MMKKDKNKTESKNSGDAKGKASFDQNGKGASPKYGQAGDTANESGKATDIKEKKGI